MNKKLIILASIGIAAMFLTVCAGTYTANLAFYAMGGRKIESGVTDKVEGDHVGLVNILLLGTDDGGYHSDTMMLVSLNGYENKVNILSVPRDTRIFVGGRASKINAALSIGKQEEWKGSNKIAEDYVIQKVKEIVGFPIHYYATVELDGFRNIIDILDGVDFDVPMRMKYDDPYQNLHIDLYPGPQHLNGAQAEGLVRYRSNNSYTQGYAEGDLGRIPVQQEFIKAIVDQKLQPQYFWKFDDIFKEIEKNVRTNYGLTEFIRHREMIKNIKAEDINMYQLPGYGAYSGDVSYFFYDTKGTAKLINDHFKPQFERLDLPEEEE